MQQLALDTEDEAPTQVDRREAQDTVAVARQPLDRADPSALLAHDVSQPLAAIVASAYACALWLAASPPNIERARIAAERIIRHANAAAEFSERPRREPHIHPAE